MFAISVDLEALRPQRHALIDAHVAADHRRFADQDARAVVDKKTLANLSAGVDVDTGKCVRDLGDDPRQ